MLPSMLPISFFLIYIILGFLAAYLAIRKNRNPIGWFLAGMCFGFFGIIILLVLPDLPPSNRDPTSDSDSEDDEPSNNVLHSILEDASVTSTPPPVDQVPVDTEKWFYLDNERKNVGPLSLENLLAFLRNKENLSKESINPEDVWVWKKGMSNWERVRNVPELNEALKILK
ncbi:GYF domain-containing protein [Chlamydia vaughanii]|uniref:GYF domain-containing protein n=1 Tax=Chlamydia vaughanii TaxID=3112552 RepID=UPI0032B25A94